MNKNIIKPVIIHVHYKFCGGLGDFFKSIITLYSYCKIENIDYYIDLSNNIFLNNCFVLKNIPENILNSEFIMINMIDKIFSEESLYSLLKKIIYTEPKVYKLASNCFGFGEKNMLLSNLDFIKKNIIYPNNIIEYYINDIYKKYNIEEKKYISIHCRCGDFYINDNKIYNDNRIDINNTDTVININSLINDFINKYNIDYPILIHSDSKEFKENIKKINSNIIILDLEIQHIANDLGKNNQESFISTIAEFYIISKANKIFIINNLSGFSHMASILENNNLYINFELSEFHNKIIKSLGPDNIINIQ
jgi:hypothetical protein